MEERSDWIGMIAESEGEYDHFTGFVDWGDTRGETHDAHFRLVQDEFMGRIVFWYGGTWVNGYWRSGTWRGGTWCGGTWIDGEWLNGTWESGTWEDGTWHNGTWKDGTWQYGTWYKGVWESGVWNHGVQIINGYVVNRDSFPDGTLKITED